MELHLRSPIYLHGVTRDNFTTYAVFPFRIWGKSWKPPPGYPISRRRCYTKQPTNSSERSPSSEAEKSSASQEILRISWNPKVHHRTHNRPQPVPIPNQINQVHTAPSNVTACVVPKEQSESEAIWNVSYYRKLQRWGIVGTSPKPQAGRPPLVGSQ